MLPTNSLGPGSDINPGITIENLIKIMQILGICIEVSNGTAHVLGLGFGLPTDSHHETIGPLGSYSVLPAASPPIENKAEDGYGKPDVNAQEDDPAPIDQGFKPFGDGLSIEHSVGMPTQPANTSGVVLKLGVQAGKRGGNLVLS